MKKKLLLIAIVCCSFFSPTGLKAQVFEYALGHIGYNETSKSIIRRVDNTSALVYYHNSGNGLGEIALIDLYRNIKKVLLPPGCKLNDMRITGDDVYFCGSDVDGPIIGHLSLSVYSLPSMRPVKIYKVDGKYVSKLKRLAAYTYDGKQKVVAIGDMRFMHDDNLGLNCNAVSPDPPYNPVSCYRTLILEAEFDHDILNSQDYTTTNDETHLEFITEVVETERYVALIGRYENNNATVIHRCGKGSVVSDFKTIPFYKYSTPLEGYSDYHGCLTKGDTIAVASLSSYYDAMGISQFSTNIRLFDISSMNNTQAQYIPMNSKYEPIEMTYMTGKGHLILLEDIYHPTIMSVQNTFMHLKPYSVTDYSAESWYESYFAKTFSSVCRLTYTHYVAAGGNYWCLKSLTPISPVDCYKAPAVDVKILGVESKVTDTYSPYEPITSPIVILSDYTFTSTTPDGLFNPGCIEFFPSYND